MKPPVQVSIVIASYKEYDSGVLFDSGVSMLTWLLFTFLFYFLIDFNTNNKVDTKKKKESVLLFLNHIVT